MAKVKVHIELDGVREYTHQGYIVSALESAAERIRDAANARCSYDTMRFMPFEMARRDELKYPLFSVFAATPHGKYAEAKSRALSKSLNAGRW